MIEIIPAIDILGGKCVRLSKGDYAQQKVYNEEPLEVAKMFEDQGLHRVHIVDLDGAKANRIVNYQVLEKIAAHTSLVIDFGGGLKSDSDLEIAFDSGAQMVTGGSIAVKNPAVFQRWIDKFGGTHIILGADARDNKISVSGWTEDTEQELIPFILHWRKQGIYRIICTDISKDGMLEGPNIDLYKQIREQDPQAYLIASGGVSSLDDVMQLEQAGIPSVIIGKAIYEGKIQLKDLLRFTE
ncbi:MAG: 1-(5-phosphoribosyl)-5-[(5-phosphoribosylamino)methylideneamino] imidazole-4-carboxamide isomerase [Candidatus Ordinivivax streblomastigis]|uniref:1-(5-phosphoribosyl)-5-[(5-phosphoribosylamino)methylideneamino] imidazole-4-carboxamide isomerase n=1 Tax=Candidatus Ordinivivax streblomastigis TaxID=2540710 RepID=A0A5M8P3W6_9BACT|nr:MAG: 1-(5-phosphoribosyl)-5-[(5-phosphoribosylamino)methylideneamino] imidazole-4-carboxamide isomerase [Candidatus Ordinivivax streblomastigis]